MVPSVFDDLCLGVGVFHVEVRRDTDSAVGFVTLAQPLPREGHLCASRTDEIGLR